MVEYRKADDVVQPVFILFKIHPFVLGDRDDGSLHGFRRVAALYALKAKKEGVFSLVWLDPAHLEGAHGLSRDCHVEFFHAQKPLGEVRLRQQQHIAAHAVDSHDLTDFASILRGPLSLL